MSYNLSILTHEKENVMKSHNKIFLALAVFALACGTSSSASMAGKWLDPDTTGTITTIVADGSGYKVTSVINPDRGENELTNSSWSNGVLTWTYCVPNGNCLTSVTTGVTSTKLNTTWTDDQGRSGTTDFERQ
jgi:FtsH-binding integral membrane protein